MLSPESLDVDGPPPEAPAPLVPLSTAVALPRAPGSHSAFCWRATVATARFNSAARLGSKLTPWQDSLCRFEVRRTTSRLRMSATCVATHKATSVSQKSGTGVDSEAQGARAEKRGRMRIREGRASQSRRRAAAVADPSADSAEQIDPYVVPLSEMVKARLQTFQASSFPWDHGGRFGSPGGRTRDFWRRDRRARRTRRQAAVTAKMPRPRVVLARRSMPIRARPGMWQAAEEKSQRM